MAKINKNFIPNIDNLAAKTLKELNLRPAFSIDKFKKKNKRFYSTRCETENNDEVFLKILISKEIVPALWLKKEALFTEFISDFAEAKKGLNIPIYLSSQMNKKPYWFMHQYLPGSLTGHHFKIYKKGLSPKIRNKIIDNIVSLQSISYKKNKKALNKINLPKRTYKEYIEKIKRFEKIINKNNDKEIDFKEIYKFFEQRKKYFNAKEFVLAHGDFTLANLFINKGNVYLTDWEQAHLDNFAADVARMWIQTFNYPKWRKKLVLYFLSKIPAKSQKKFKESFRAITIVEALVEFASSPKSKKESKIKKMQKQTLACAIKGFNHLINLEKI